MGKAPAGQMLGGTEAISVASRVDIPRGFGSHCCWLGPVGCLSGVRRGAEREEVVTISAALIAIVREIARHDEREGSGAEAPLGMAIGGQDHVDEYLGLAADRGGAARSAASVKQSSAFATDFGPCLDGSRGARALFGEWAWSVATMCAASDLHRMRCARAAEVRRRSGSGRCACGAPSLRRHARAGSPVRAGCPEACVVVLSPSPHVATEARLRRGAQHLS